MSELSAKIPKPIEDIAKTEGKVIEEKLRDEKLRALLGTDYEFAKQQGLIDMFKYDPNSGQDGLMHLLTGNLTTSPDGGEIAEGFHHLASAQILQAAEIGAHDTYTEPVDTTNASSEHKKYYRRFPYEPYRTPVVISGKPKMGMTRDKTGVKRADNSMFPDEYDPLTILRTIQMARDNRDTEQDNLVERPDGWLIVNTSKVPMLDGEHELKIRLVMDDQEKIITAIPNQNPGQMKLDEEAIRTHLGLA